MDNKKTKLTRKQKLFCNYYIACLNATEAYQKAFKNDNLDTCRVNACKLLKRPEIREMVDDILAEKDNDLVADQNEVLIYFTDVMRGKIKDQFDLDAPLKERNKAAELLARKHGMFNDKVKLDGAIPVVITGEDELAD